MPPLGSFHRSRAGNDNRRLRVGIDLGHDVSVAARFTQTGYLVRRSRRDPVVAPEIEEQNLVERSYNPFAKETVNPLCPVRRFRDGARRSDLAHVGGVLRGVSCLALWREGSCFAFVLDRLLPFARGGRRRAVLGRYGSSHQRGREG